ncbi:MAG: hypothetical protein HY833_03660 [Candidatus Aenigmarchaeota archaeon]|nr:hypothetical protein [Candidatus Aenigmarchaeota archaeon]
MISLKQFDMKCWNCKHLINHKKVNWYIRKVGVKNDKIGVLTAMLRELAKSLGNEKSISTQNNIFGALEYEYNGKCMFCNERINLFWFGKDSIKKNKNTFIEKKIFRCVDCNNIIHRELQVWYSYSILQKNNVIKEYLVTLCPNCKNEEIYPFKYDLEHGIIK